MAAAIAARAEDASKNHCRRSRQWVRSGDRRGRGDPEWELLSFTTSRLRSRPEQPSDQAFFLPARLAGSAATTFVSRGSSRTSIITAWSQSPPSGGAAPWNTFGPWKTADVIDGISGLRDNIGVVVVPQRGLATATDAVPAVLLSESGAVDRPIEGYRVVMRSSRTAASLLYRLQRLDAAAPPLLERRLPGDFIRGEPIAFDLTAPPAEGRYRLTVCATPARPLPEYHNPGGQCADSDIERSYAFDHVGRLQVDAARP